MIQHPAVMTDVSTSLVHPDTAYRLTVDDNMWTFGHPRWWGRKTDIGMDANNQWGDFDTAKEMFYEYVSDSVVWPSGAWIATEVMREAKIAEKRRVAVSEGHQELF